MKRSLPGRPLAIVFALVASAGMPHAVAAQAGCARPNISATIIRAVPLESTSTAQPQGATGTLQVVVSLDASSRVTGTRIQSSPSVLLNSAALTAARASTYQTEIRNCVPIAADVLFNVTVSNDGMPGATGGPAAFVQSGRGPAIAVSNSDAPTVVITAQGVASRPPDVAYLNAGIVTNDDVAATATSKNNAIYDALKTRLRGLGVDESQIKTSYYNVAYLARPTPPPDLRTPAPAYPYPGPAQRFGYVVSRQLVVTVSAVANAGAAGDAALAAGATTVGSAQYNLLDRSAAYQEALAAALKDAASQAQVVASASRMRLAGIKQIQVGQNFNGPPTPMPGPQVRGPVGSMLPSMPTDMHPSPVEVRASVTVTYLLKPGS